MIGVNAYVAHSPALNITVANSGDNPAFIKAGTIDGLIIAHLLIVTGKNIVDI